MAESNTEPMIESVATLPPDEPLDAAMPLPSAVPAPAPSNLSSNEKSSSVGRSSDAISRKPPASSLLATVPSKMDGFLTHLLRCLQTRSGADVVLLFLTYTTRLSGSLLESLSRNVFKHSAQRLVSLFFQLPPQTTVVVATPRVPPAAALALRLSQRLKAASAMLSDWRAMGRLWGLLGLYFAAKRLVLKGRSAKIGSEKEDVTMNNEERFDYALAWAQVISLISFQAAENVAYLSSKKILPFTPQTQGKLAVWSVRSWAAYIGMELGKLLVERSRKLSDGQARDVTWSSEWKKNFRNNLAWAPLTVHWSIANGPLSDNAIGAFACIPALSAMSDLWRSTA